MNIDKKLLEDLSRRLGLKVSTIRDLLDAGWTYTEQIDKPSRWEHPFASFGLN